MFVHYDKHLLKACANDTLQFIETFALTFETNAIREKTLVTTDM